MKRSTARKALPLAAVTAAAALGARGVTNKTDHHSVLPKGTPIAFSIKQDKVSEVAYDVAYPQNAEIYKAQGLGKHILHMEATRDGASLTVSVLAPHRAHLPHVDNPPVLITGEGYISTDDPKLIKKLENQGAHPAATSLTIGSKGSESFGEIKIPGEKTRSIEVLNLGSGVLHIVLGDDVSGLIKPRSETSEVSASSYTVTDRSGDLELLHSDAYGASQELLAEYHTP